MRARSARRRWSERRSELTALSAESQWHPCCSLGIDIFIRGGIKVLMAFFPGPESACPAAIGPELPAANLPDLVGRQQTAAKQRAKRTRRVAFREARGEDLPPPPVDCEFLNPVLLLRSVSVCRSVGATLTVLRKVQVHQLGQQKLVAAVWQSDPPRQVFSAPVQ